MGNSKEIDIIITDRLAIVDGKPRQLTYRTRPGQITIIDPNGVGETLTYAAGASRTLALDELCIAVNRAGLGSINLRRHGAMEFIDADTPTFGVDYEGARYDFYWGRPESYAEEIRKRHRTHPFSDS